MVDLRATNDKLTDRAIRILIEFSSELTREDSARLLGRADDDLKTAIVMQRLGVDAEQASELLDGNDGVLGRILHD